MLRLRSPLKSLCGVLRRFPHNMPLESSYLPSLKCQQVNMSTSSKYSYQREIRTRCGDMVIREAKIEDKEAILNIRRNLYGGTDYLPVYFNQLINPPNGKAFLFLLDDVLIGFISAMIINQGTTCFINGYRVCKEMEGHHLTPVLFKSVGEWAKPKGAGKIAGTLTDHFLPNDKYIMTRFYLNYMMRLELVNLRQSDVTAASHVMQIPLDQLSDYINSPAICNNLFPYERILVDFVPYSLKESNIRFMKGYSDKHTEAFSDVHVENHNVRGLLSFGTFFKAQSVSFVYCIELYGTDTTSIRNHVVKHLSALKQKANGTVLFMILLQENHPEKHINNICLEFGMSRLNCAGTSYPQLNYSKQYVFEREYADYSQSKQIYLVSDDKIQRKASSYSQ